MEVKKISPLTKEYWEFVYIVSKSFPLHIPLMIWASLRKMAVVFVCKLHGKIIGGFVVTDLPLNTFIFRPYNFFSNKKTRAFKQLIKKGYRYLTYVVIEKEYRGNGYGLKMMQTARKNHDIKSYFTPFTSGLQKFYEKSGAIVYKTQNGKTLRGINSPVMVFEGKAENDIATPMRLYS
ncbi:MAG: GNAT family N-acetyltransferase [Patescibacteria group bacterium]